MNNEQNKPVELTEKELAGIAGGATKKILELKTRTTNLRCSLSGELFAEKMPN